MFFHTYGAKIFFVPIRLLSGLYYMVLLLRDCFYRMKWIEVHRFGKPVISIGNITVGGTGKTPMTAYVAQRLLTHGYTPAILSRGYGSRKKKIPLILTKKNRHTLSTDETGDEPMMLSKQLPDVSVYVFHKRRVSAALAEKNADFLILDDGFQRRDIFRDINLLLIDAAIRFGNKRLLPAGILRDRYCHIAQADGILITKTNLIDLECLTALKKTLPNDIPLFTQRQKTTGVYQLTTGKKYTLDALRGKTFFAFCGLAYPELFFRSLEQWGLTLADTVALPDHHPYTETLSEKLIRRFVSGGMDFMIATEKDAVKITKKNPLYSDKLLIATVASECSKEFDAYLDVRINELADRYRLPKQPATPNQ